MNEEERLDRFKRLLDEAWMNAGGMLGYMGQSHKNASAFIEYVNSRRHLPEYGGEGEPNGKQE